MKKLYITLHIIFLIVLSSFVSAALIDDISNYYNFEQTSGDLVDQVGGLDGSGDNVTDKSATGIISNGWDFEFDNTDYVALPDLVIEGKGEITINLWAKFESYATIPQLWGYIPAGRITGIYWHAGEAKWYVFVSDVDTETQFSVTGKDPGIGEWQMYTFTYSDTDNNVSFFINGTFIDSKTHTGVLPSGDYNFSIGGLLVADPYPNQRFDGIIDEFGIWDRTLTLTEISELYNDGAGFTYPFGVAGVPATPTIVAPSPADNSNNNTNVTLNVTHSSGLNDVKYYLYFGESSTLTETDLYLDNVTRSEDEYRNFTTNVSDGTYYWKWRVQNITDGAFSSNTTQRTLIIDTVNPTITLGGNHNISTTNTTIISNYLFNLSINVSFYDSNLYQTLINITNETGHSLYQILNTSITGTTVNYTKTIDISNWSIGNYTLKLIATDSHTALSISDYDVIKGINYLRYETEEGNRIKITSNTLPLTFKTTKETDRYDFSFNYLFQKDTYKFIIEADNKITYLPSSQYAAHFVIMGNNGRGNWIDFSHPSLNKKDYTISKIDDYIYEIEINAPTIKNFEFKSLGGLNTVQKDYSFQIGAVYDIWVHESENNNPLNATATLDSQSAHTISRVSPAQLVNVTKEDISIVLNSTGYGSETKSISPTVSFHNVTFNMTVVSAVKIYYYDESTVTLIEGETFLTYLETTGFSNTYSATTNPYTITSLPNGLYKIKASSTNYPERQMLDVNISNVTTTNINMYFINSSDSAEKTFSIFSETLSPLEDVFVVFTRLINGTRTTIAEEYSDYAGQVKLDLDENYEYTINFSKTGYETQIISLEPTESEYVITLISTVGIYNQSVYEGIRYKFEPSNTVLNNNTEYNFTFTLNSTVWEVTNCTLRLFNGTSVLLNETSSNTANSCFLRIELNTANMTDITSEARYELNSAYNFTVSQQYSIIYTYEGEFSLKNFLDDLSDFSMAGFDNFGRMILAFVVIFVILAMASMKISFEHKEVPLFIFWALVGFFSYVNWFYLDLATMPEILGLKKYFIFYLITLVGGAFIWNKMRK